MPATKSIEEIFEITKAALQKAGFSWIVVDTLNYDESKKAWHVKAIVGISDKKEKALIIDDITGRILGFE